MGDLSRSISDNKETLKIISDLFVRFMGDLLEEAKIRDELIDEDLFELETLVGSNTTTNIWLFSKIRRKVWEKE